MTAKPAKKKVPTPSAISPAPVADNSVAAASTATALDPQRSIVGKLVVAAVWLYVAALWLLALDQTFKWGIFGPTAASLP